MTAKPFVNPNGQSLQPLQEEARNWFSPGEGRNNLSPAASNVPRQPPHAPLAEPFTSGWAQAGCEPFGKGAQGQPASLAQLLQPVQARESSGKGEIYCNALLGPAEMKPVCLVTPEQASYQQQISALGTEFLARLSPTHLGGKEGIHILPGSQLGTGSQGSQHILLIRNLQGTELQSEH